jgi:hypothetical protein
MFIGVGSGIGLKRPTEACKPFLFVWVHTARAAVPEKRFKKFVCAEIQLANHKLRFSLFHFIKSFPPKELMKGPLRIASHGN